jgi:uncharacterized protein (DUF433 family)
MPELKELSAQYITWREHLGRGPVILQEEGQDPWGVLLPYHQFRQLQEATATHPYITCVPGKRGGRAIIRGTGITVALIARLYKAGDTVDEILQGYSYLQPSWVYDAIGYYLDHRDEIEREIQESRVDALTKWHHFMVDERGFAHFLAPDESID